MKTETLSGALYYFTFTDDCSRKLGVYVMKTKDQLPFDGYCKHQGIRQQKTPTKTPQLNGMAERMMNMTLMRKVRCFLSEAKLLNSFWCEALLTIAHVNDLTHVVALQSDVPNSVCYERKIYLFHKKYIECVLERFNMKNVKPVSTPLACHMKLRKKMCPTARGGKENMAKVPYSSGVGSLMYAIVCTRPNIAHAVGAISKFLENPGKEHWETVN
ncbi:uncharacterized protein [Solanum lycopersicum]|uniref:uncharacterized protein n=1 Tax=Solanum lycopersicum TaxID=4081 RepID=UPI00374841F3